MWLLFMVPSDNTRTLYLWKGIWFQFYAVSKWNKCHSSSSNTIKIHRVQHVIFFLSNFRFELNWTELRTDIKAHQTPHKGWLGDESITKVIISLQWHILYNSFSSWIYFSKTSRTEMFLYASTALTALFEQISDKPVICRQHHRRWREALICVFMTNKGWNTDGLNTEICWLTPRLKVMKCVFKRASQTTESVNYKQKNNLQNGNISFLFLNMYIYIYCMGDFSSQGPTQLLQPMKLMLPYQHLLRPNTSLL